MPFTEWGAARNTSRRWTSVTRLGERMQVQRPVERGVATADDHHPLAGEGVHLAHGIEDRGALIGLDAGDGGLLGLERAAAGRNQDHLALEHGAGIGGDAEARVGVVAQHLDRLHHLALVEHRAERLALLDEVVDEALAGDHGEAGNVVDRLFGVELRALAARLAEDVDQMRLDVEQAEFEHGEEADRPHPDDHRVGDHGLGGRGVHRLSPAGPGCARSGRPAPA